MSIKDSVLGEIEETRIRYLQLLDSIPESDYSLPADNPAWTVGDLLYHITLGPIALRFEIWMIRTAPGLFQFVLNDFTAKLFNWINAPFARRGKRITRQRLIKAYEAGHAGLRSSLRRMKEDDFRKSIIYPKSFVAELAGEVTVERLFHYVKGHFEMHAAQLGIASAGKAPASQ